MLDDPSVYDRLDCFVFNIKRERKRERIKTHQEQIPSDIIIDRGHWHVPRKGKHFRIEAMDKK